MKTAITLDEILMREIAVAARQMVTRTQLVSIATTEFLRRKREAELLAQLNEVYGQPMDEPMSPSTASMKRKFATTLQDQW